MPPTPTELWSQAPGYEVVGPAPFDLSVGANGGHGEGGDDSDHARQQNDDSGQTNTSLSNHPAQSDEQHHAPDVQQAANLIKEKDKEQPKISFCTHGPLLGGESLD